MSILNTPKLRLYGWNGKGLFLLKVNPRTGNVDEVKVLKSTGHVMFNEFAAKAFFQWKFRPGTLKQLDVPVVFDRSVHVLLKNAGSK